MPKFQYRPRWRRNLLTGMVAGLATLVTLTGLPTTADASASTPVIETECGLFGTRSRIVIDYRGTPSSVVLRSVAGDRLDFGKSARIELVSPDAWRGVPANIPPGTWTVHARNSAGGMTSRQLEIGSWDSFWGRFPITPCDYTDFVNPRPLGPAPARPLPPPRRVRSADPSVSPVTAAPSP